MGLSDNIQNMFGVVTVQIEGFFTERFINLCRITNVKIWDVRNIVKGVVRFKMKISDFKKLRPIAKKTKCKVTIKEKDGIYFKMFKYRKRKIVAVLVIFMIIFCISFSTFVWNIEVTGNITVSSDEIVNNLKESGLYVGKNKIGLDKKEVVNNLRIKMPNLAWVGVDIDGTKVQVKVVEKTKIDEKDVQNIVPGDIIADKSGIITRIIAENGTAKYKEGSYIEEGAVLIEGTLYSKVLEPVRVPAKGIVKINSEYSLKKEYKYENTNREYLDANRYTIGVTINSKEKMINYLNKSKKYDITKKSKIINIFGISLSFDFYICKEYKENIVTNTRDELLKIAESEINSHIENQILSNTLNGVFVDKTLNVQDNVDGITVDVKYIINEQIGKFVERNTYEY